MSPCGTPHMTRFTCLRTPTPVTSSALLLPLLSLLATSAAAAAAVSFVPVGALPASVDASTMPDALLTRVDAATTSSGPDVTESPGPVSEEASSAQPTTRGGLDATWENEVNQTSTEEAEAPQSPSTAETNSTPPATAPTATSHASPPPFHSSVPLVIPADATSIDTRLRPPPPEIPNSVLGRVDEYFSGYEYPDPANESISGREPGVIPDPGRLEDAPEGEEEAEQEGIEVEAEEEEETDARGLPLHLPDDSLADADLHDHDLIDSVMYIYFGGGNGAGNSRHGGRSACGRRALAAGSALALLAQLLALGSAVRRLARSKGGDEAAAALAHTAVALAAASGAWLLGAPLPPAPSPATSIPGQGEAWQGRCVAQALLLHWLHAAAACWLLLASLLVLRRLRDAPPPRARRWAPLAWGIPAILVAVCYGTDPHCYETSRFCWVSVERGMLLSFLLPVGALIVANTWLAVASLRQLTPAPESPTKCPSKSPGALSPLPLLLAPPEAENAMRRRAVRAAAALLPLFAVHWFLAVLALENPSSLVLAASDAALNCFLSWFLLWSASAVWAAPEDMSDGFLEPPETQTKPLLGAGTGPGLARKDNEVVTLLCASSPPRGPSDVQPLLAPEPSWGAAVGGAAPFSGRRVGAGVGAELLELRLDALSTVSTISS